MPKPKKKKPSSRKAPEKTSGPGVRPLWSGTITRKQDHRIVDTGPYALVRHPIYTGLLLAGFATAIARGRWEALIGAALFALGCWIKARQEERFLSEELGHEYAAYRKRVPMLVPFLPA